MCQQLCSVNAGHRTVNATDVASAFVAFTDHREGCLLSDLLDMGLPCECRSGPSSSPCGKAGQTPEVLLQE